MKAVLNRALFEKLGADSGAFGVLESVVHQFTKPGAYRVTVFLHDRSVATTDLRVDAAATEAALYVDLSTLQRGLADDACACEGKEQHKNVIKPEGYVVFHTSKGNSGYAVVVERETNRERAHEFDSRRLERGDIYALSLLRPGTYTVRNTLEGGSGQIILGNPPKDKSPVGLDPIYVDSGRKVPDKLDLLPTQGLVFRITEPSRIVIALRDEAKPEQQDRPRAHWQHPR